MGKDRRTMEMSATVRWRPRTARGSAVKADYAPGLESRVRGNVPAQVRRGAVGNVPRGNALAAYSTRETRYHIDPHSFNRRVIVPCIAATRRILSALAYPGSECRADRDRNRDA